MSDTERERAFDRRLGVIGVVAVLLAALIGAGAGIVGSIVGERYQASANHDEQRADFRRSQELTIYSNYVQVANDVYSDASAYITDVERRVLSKSQSDAEEKALQLLAAKQGTLQQVIDQIHIVGSDGAYSASLVFRNHVADALEAKQTAANGPAFDAILNTLYKRLFADVNAFIAIAAADVKG